MKGDFSRFTHDPSKRYTGVLKQQGRVDLDADWNEYVEIQDHLRRTMETDLIGGSGVPDKAGGFHISWDTGKEDLMISPDASAEPGRPSRMYVDSILCELEGKVPYASQPDYPSPTPLNQVNGRVDLVYLDVWQRHVTAIEDPELREEALAGPDTTTRLQTVWQVKVKQNVPGPLPASCSPEALPQDWPLPELGGGRLSTGGRYRGSENRLYRVEIHDRGKATASSDYATFKWSRDNGTVVFPIEAPTELQPKNKVRVSRLGRDQALALREGDWVEVGGDESELKGEPGLLAQIREDGIDRMRLELTLSVDDVSSYAQQNHPKVRRWDQTEAGGACKVREGEEIELEDGVKIRFEPGNPDHEYRTGDFWIFTVRAATGKVEELAEAPPQIVPPRVPLPRVVPPIAIPPRIVPPRIVPPLVAPPRGVPPRGVRHHYCPLALVKWSVAAQGTTVEIRDCRVRFGSLKGQLATVESFFYLGGDGQKAMPGNEVLQPLRVGLTKGGQPLDNRQIRFTIEEGAGKLRKVDSSPTPPYNSLTVRTQGGIAECAWELGSATQAQKVAATVVNGSQAPIFFTADSSLGWHVPEKPFAGIKVDGPVVFGRSGGALGSSHGGQELALRWDVLRNVRIGRAPTLPPTFVARWGSQGTGNGQFDQPVGIAVDSSGNVYVADTGNYRVQKFTSNGAFVAKWGSQGTGNGQFDHPEGIAVDSSGNVYVGDWEDRIQKFNSNGTFLTKWGSPGSGDGQFNSKAGVAVDAQGNVYVADAGNYRVQKFTSNGAFIAKWGSQGSGNGQFLQPMDVAVDSSGNVYVIDTGWPAFLPRIQKFNSNGTFLAKWGGPGSGDGQLSHPTGVAVDSSGNVYVADAGNYRVQKFTSNGAFIAKWGSQGSGDGQFGNPPDVAVDPSGNIYVLDRFISFPRIQKFAETRGNLSIEGILSTQNAGIGTINSERWRLTIQAGELMSFKNAAGTTKWHINDWSGSALGSGNLNFAETGVADGRFYLKAGGNVGIGTTNPAAKLTIAGGGDLLFRASSEIPDDPGDIVFQTSAGTQKGRIWSNPSPGAALFLSSGDNTPRITIGADGRVGIGRTPQYNLDVSGTLRVSSELNIGNGTPINRLRAGTMFVGNSQSVTKTATANFNTAFPAVPKIVVVARGEPGSNHPDVFAVTVRSASQGAFTVTVRRLDANSGWGQNLQVDWIAWVQAHDATPFP